MGSSEHMDPIAALREAIAAERDVLGRVQPGQLAMASPCAAWTVAGVIEHSIGVFARFAQAMTGVPPAAAATDFVAGELAAFDTLTAACLAAFEADGALDRSIAMGSREMPAAAAISLITTDSLVHAWDIARGTGQSTDLAPELSAAVLARARQSISPQQRGPEGTAPFGPEQPVGDEAPNADKLAGFLGRVV